MIKESFVTILGFELELLCNFGVVSKLELNLRNLLELSLNWLDCLDFNIVKLRENNLSILYRDGV